jgi:hypothetical protein
LQESSTFSWKISRKLLTRFGTCAIILLMENSELSKEPIMQLEVGGVYRSRGGEKVTISRIDQGSRSFCYEGDNKRFYKDDGRWGISGSHTHDLIATWTDEPVATEQPIAPPEPAPAPTTTIEVLLTHLFGDDREALIFPGAAYCEVIDGRLDVLGENDDYIGAVNGNWIAWRRVTN